MLSDATFRGAVDDGALIVSPPHARSDLDWDWDLDWDSGLGQSLGVVRARGRRINGLGGSFHPVAAIFLGAVERIIGARDQHVDGRRRRAR